MAQLNSRGTLTRGRWDYFEHSNGISSVWGSVASGPIGCYFANNSSGATAIDVYTLNWSASVSGLFAIGLFLPSIILTPLAPSESHLFAVAPDTAAPPGINGMFTNLASPYYTFIRYSAGSGGAQMAPIMGSYFATLPPGWAISISGPGSSSPCELAMTVWFQYVTDNIAPAM
jgi:hypothetical protein